MDLREELSETAALVARARTIQSLLDTQLAAHEAALLERAEKHGGDYKKRSLAAIEQAKQGRTKGIAANFLLDSRWAYDLASTLVESRTITVWADMTTSTKAYDANINTSMYWEDTNRAAYLIAKMLRDINPTHTTHLCLLTNTPTESVPALQDDSTVVDLANYTTKAKSFIDRLAQSDAGTVVNAFGQLNFKLAPWLQEWAQLQYSNEHREEIRQIVLGPAYCYENNDATHMRSDIVSSMPIAEMAGEAEMHLMIGSYNRTKFSCILRALGVIRCDNFHMIHGFNDPAEAELQVLHVGYVFRQELERYTISLLRDQSFNDLDIEKYVALNYGNILEQDKEIMRIQLAAESAVATQLGIDVAKPETLLKDLEAAHVCIGGNMYPVMLRERLSNGKILGIDIAPSVQGYISEIKHGSHTDPWKQHEDEIVRAAYELGMDGSAFGGSLASAAKKLQIVIDDVHKLRGHSLRLIEMHFGAEATGGTRSNFYCVLRTIRAALKGNTAVFEAVLTMNSSETWPDGVKHLPAVSMDEDEYTLALIDSGFEILEKRLIGANLSEDEKLRPHEDFIYYRCAPRVNTATPAQQTKGKKYLVP